MTDSTSTETSDEHPETDSKQSAEISASKAAPDDRPLVTFALFAYNQEEYIREAVEGALSQTYSPLEIIVSDDCSQDNTFNVLKELADNYQGPHRLSIIQNSVNLGLIEHIERVCEMATGELIVVAAGDDISLPCRVERVLGTWKDLGFRTCSIFTDIATIDKNGDPIKSDVAGKVEGNKIKEKWIAELNSHAERAVHGVCGCSHAFTPDLIRQFTSLDRSIVQEDFIIPLRALLVGAVAFNPHQTVKYRILEFSLSHIGFRSSRERFAAMARYWNGRLAIYNQFEIDSSLAIRRGYVTQDEVAELMEHLRKDRCLAHLHKRFFAASSYLTRFLAVANGIGYVPFVQLLKWLAIAIFPALYSLRMPRFRFRQ